MNTNADGTVVVNADGSVSIKNDGYIKCVADHNGVVEDCDNKYGRIKGGAEYFCGDGVVQCKSGDSKCSGTTVSTTNYPGAKISEFGASEACEPSDSQKTLCDRYLNKNGKLTNSSYYSSDIGCKADCTEITGDTTCGFCGDGILQSNESCGEETPYNRYGSAPTATSGTAKERCAAAFTVSNGYKYYINIPGVYCFTVKGGDGNKGDADNACSGATVKGCYKLQKGDVITFRIGSVGETRPADSSSVCSGTYSGGGGGGASWVYLTRSGSHTLLLVAGGGGGGGYYNNTSGDNAYKTCGGGSSSTSANNNSSNTADNCTDNGASDGTTVNTSNFASLTAANGGDGGYHYTTKCSGKECDSKYACGGGGGGYVGGAKGTKDFGGGGGGSYVNTNTTYYSTGSSLTAGTNSGVTPSGGSITVQKPNSNATCSSCTWSTSYSTCN